MLPRVFLLFLINWPLAAEKRPFSADDYARWKHIQNQQLSPDGHVLVDAAFPKEGDGELVVRDLRSGKETRQPAGELPPPPPPNNATPQVEEGPAPPLGVAVKFSNDSQKVAFLTFASHDLVEKAKREKRKPEDMPKGDLVIVNVASGDAARIPHVLSFEMPAKSSDFLAYLQQQEGSSAEGKSASTVSPPASSRTGKGETRGRLTQLGDLVIRTLKDGTERRFPDTTEYLLAQDGTLAVFAVASRQPESAGVFALRTAGAGGPAALLTGKGKYERLAWDREQRTLAFVSDRGMADSKQAGFGLYMWDRQAPAASQLASAETARIPKDWIISDKPPITVARGGKRIFFGTAPRPKPELPPDNTPPDEKLTMDLWSWKDDYIQPMQKVRLAVERGRTYRAVYDLASHRVTQLADPSMSEASPSDDGNYVIGGDDREYRRMQEYSERLEDTYFVDVATGWEKTDRQETFRAFGLVSRFETCRLLQRKRLDTHLCGGFRYCKSDQWAACAIRA